MKQYYFLWLLSGLILFGGCKDDEGEDTPTPPHQVTIYSHSQPEAKKALASVRYSGDLMRYCGATDEDGNPDLVKSATFAIEGRNELLHYLFDEQGRVELAYTSIDGVNQSELHKLEYGTLDSVYYSVHQFNWDNGVNFLSYEVAFGKWGDEYLGNLLFAKNESQAIESANQSIKLFSDLSVLFVENLEEIEFNSIHANIAPKLSGMVSWKSPSITLEDASESDPFACYIFDNNPNPNGTPENPTGTLDDCFNSSMEVLVDFFPSNGSWRINLSISGGTPPYAVSINGGPYAGILFNPTAPEPGPYTFDVVDGNGCTTTHIAVREDECADSDLAVVLTSSPAAASAEGQGGTPPYMYRWYSGETLITTASGSTNFSEGTYTCTVIDGNLCEASAEIYIEGKCQGMTTVEDVDGNVYPLTEIGGQCWMAENLRATSLNSGANIPNRTNELLWESTGVYARTAFDNDPANVEIYGYLYNHKAVTTSAGICPTGWHVPDRAEMETLISATGGSQVAGLALKSTTLWADIEGGGPGNNSSGFNAPPGGERDGVQGISSDFDFDGIAARYWTSDLNGTNEAYFMSLSAGSGSAQVYFFGDLNDGYSVRCLKD